MVTIVLYSQLFAVVCVRHVYLPLSVAADADWTELGTRAEKHYLSQLKQGEWKNVLSLNE